MRKNVRNTAAALLPAAFWLIVAMAWILPAGMAQAHGPSDLKFNYDAATQTLQVTITHSSPIPTSHYIKRVEIRKGGALLVAQDYKSQPDAPAFSYSYKVQAAPGDVLEVKATCNLWGSKTAKFTVPAK